MFMEREPTLWDGIEGVELEVGIRVAGGGEEKVEPVTVVDGAAVRVEDGADTVEAPAVPGAVLEVGMPMGTSARVLNDGGSKEPPTSGGESHIVASEGDRLEEAKARFQAGDLDGAASLCSDLLLDDPGNVQVRLLLGQIYERRGDNYQALEQYEAARAAEPENVDILARLGMVLAALGRFEQAERELRRAQRLDPNRADVHATVGILHFKRGLYGPAEVELRRTIELDPDHAAAHFYRGESLNQLGRVDEALEMLARAVQLDPTNARAYYTMGILYDKKRLPQQAEAMFRKAREVARG